MSFFHAYIAGCSHGYLRSNLKVVTFFPPKKCVEFKSYILPAKKIVEFKSYILPAKKATNFELLSTYRQAGSAPSMAYGFAIKVPLL